MPRVLCIGLQGAASVAGATIGACLSRCNSLMHWLLMGWRCDWLQLWYGR